MALGKGKVSKDPLPLILDLYDVKCISFCDLRSIRRNETYCATLGKTSKCRIKNGKQGAGGVESSKKEKTEDGRQKCVCARVRVRTTDLKIRLDSAS